MHRLRPESYVIGTTNFARYFGAKFGDDFVAFENNRRVSNGEQTRTVAHLAMKRGPSVDFSGYWQRHVKVA